MLDFLLFSGFVSSFLLVLFSSYFFSAIIKSKSSFNSFIYFVLIFISQIISSIELLSLIKSINPSGILIINSIVLAVSFGLWEFFKRPNYIYPEKFKLLAKDILNALKKDKFLLIISIIFGISCIILLLLTIFVPTDNMDSLTYRLGRIAIWVQNGTLQHFETTSIRQLCFPINFEVMILWSWTFLKRDSLALFPSFLSYFGCLGLVFGYLKYFNISTRRILWVLLIIVSLPIFLLEATSAQSDLFMGFLLLASLYLLVYSIREKEITPAIFVGVAYAIAIGAKSTAFLFVPAFVVVTVLMFLREKENKPVRQIIAAAISFVIFFIILSSYNYIQNHFTFNSIFGPESIVSSNTVNGIKPLPVNLARFFFAFIDLPGIDYTGLKLIRKIDSLIVGVHNGLISEYGLSPKFGINMGFFEGFNFRVHENYSSFGFLNYLLIVPFIVISLLKLKSKKDRTFYMAMTGLFIPCFFLMMLLFMGYSVWSLRYFATAAALSAPMLIFSYNRKTNWYKYLISSILIFNFIIYTVFNWEKPLPEVINTFAEHKNYMEARRDLRLRNGFYYTNNYREYALLNGIRKIIPENARIALFFVEEDSIYPFFEEGSDWEIYPSRYDRFIKEKRFDYYDFLIVSTKVQEIYSLEPKPDINYTPDYKSRNIKFDNKSDEDAKTVYLDKAGKIIFSGNSAKAVKLVNLIDEKNFSKYFEKIKTIKSEMPDKRMSRTYIVYKRKAIW